MDKDVIKLRVEAEVDRAKSAFSSLGGALKSITGSIIGGLGKVLDMLQNVVTTAAGALVGALASSVRTAADFEFVMSGVGAVLQASASEMENLNELAKRLGRETIFTATDAAEALEMLAQQGITYEQIMGGAGDATLALAAATKTDMTTAAEVAAAAMNVFGIEAKDMNSVVDTIAGVIANSSATITDFRFSLQQGAATAAMFGQEFDDVATTIAFFAKSGVKGERAGTGLHMLFQQLTPATKKAADEMEKYGLIVDGQNRFFDEQTGKMKDIYQITGLLQEAFGDLSDEQRAVAMETIFGSRAQRFANLLYLEGADNLKALNKEIVNTSAAEMAERRMDNFKGAVERLSGEIETAKITIGEALLPVLTSIVNKVEEWVAAAQPFFEYLGRNATEIIRILTEKIQEMFGLDFSRIEGAFQPLLDFFKGFQDVRDTDIEVSVGADMGPATGALGRFNQEVRRSEVEVDTRPAEEAVSQFRDTVLTVIENLFGPDIRGTAEELLGIIQKVFEDLSSEETQKSILSLIENLPGAISFIADLVGWLAKAAGFLTSVANNITEAKEGFAAWDAMMADLFAIDFTQIARDWIGGLTSGISEKWGELSSTVGTKVDELSTSIGEAFSGIVATASETFGGMVAAVSEKWEEIKTDTAAKWAEIKEQVSTKLESILTTVTDKMQEILDDITEKWNSAYQNTMAALQQMWSEVRTRFDAILRTAADKMTAILGDITQKWEEAKAETSRVLGEIWTAISTKFTEYKTEISAKMAEIKATIETKWEEAKAAVTTKLQEIWTAVSTKFLEMKAEVETRMTEISTRIGEIWETIRSTISTKISEAANALKDKLSDMRQWVQDEITGPDGIVSKAKNLGKSIVQGLWDGWNELWDDFWSAVTGGLGKILAFLERLAGALGRGGEPEPPGTGFPGLPGGPPGGKGGGAAPPDSFPGAGTSTGVPPLRGGAPQPLVINLSVILKMGHMEIARQDEQIQKVAAWKADLWTVGA